MIVRQLDLVCVATFPPEADPPLVVDPDTMLTFSATFEFL